MLFFSLPFLFSPKVLSVESCRVCGCRGGTVGSSCGGGAWQFLLCLQGGSRSSGGCCWWPLLRGLQAVVAPWAVTGGSCSPHGCRQLSWVPWAAAGSLRGHGWWLLPMQLWVVPASSMHGRDWGSRWQLLATLVHVGADSGCWLMAGPRKQLMAPHAVLGSSCSWSWCLGLKPLTGGRGAHFRTHSNPQPRRLESGCLWVLC